MVSRTDTRLRRTTEKRQHIATCVFAFYIEYKIMNNTAFDTSTEYALKYCRYDDASGNRQWHQMSQEQVKKIDEDIARKVHRETNSVNEIALTIFYGSPAAQACTDELQRRNYVASVLLAVAPFSKALIA